MTKERLRFVSPHVDVASKIVAVGDPNVSLPSPWVFKHLYPWSRRLDGLHAFG